MENVINFIIFQILDQGPVFIGLIAAVGLILQKKKASVVLEGTIKTVVGLLIISLGAGVLMGTMGGIMGTLNDMIQVKGVLPVNEAAWAVAMKTMSNTITLTFLAGFFMHLAMVWLIPWKIFKNVYLTAHMMLFLACFADVTLEHIFHLSGMTLILSAGFMCALYWTLTPAIARKLGKDFLEDDLTLGFASQVAAFFATRIAKVVGDPKDDAENLQLPKYLAMFRDTTISMSVLMPIMFIAIGLVVGGEAIEGLSGGQNWFIYLVIQGLTFAAGIVILLSGVRLFISNIVAAFKGISSKLIPGAVPALDAPAVFPYSPTGAMIGFIGSLFGAFFALALMIVGSSPVIVFPSIIMMFFDGGVLGVFGNKYGGWKGAFMAGLVCNFFGHLGCAYIYPMLGPIYGSGLMFSNTDYFFIWTPVMFILNLIAGNGF